MIEIIKKYGLLIIILPIILIGCAENKEAEKEEHKESEHSQLVKLSAKSIKDIDLKTETVSLKPFTGFITIPAKVLANQDNEAQVGSLVQGRVFSVHVKVGDYVKQGQILMYVEGLEIGEIKASYLKAKASLDYAKADYLRHKALFDQNIGSKQSFYEAESEYEKASAEFNAEDKKIHSIGLSDDDVLIGSTGLSEAHTSGTLPVKSPITGVVVERNVVIGQLVDGTTNAFKIINSSNIWVDGQIYEKDINKIMEKSEAQFTTSAFLDEKYEGRVTYIGQTIDERTRTITIRAEFANRNGKMKPQMFGELNIPAGKNSKAILIPSESIIKIDNADYVFVQKDDSTFEKRAVSIGASQKDLLEIKVGLKENERVVVKGAFYLKSELMKEELEGDEH